MAYGRLWPRLIIYGFSQRGMEQIGIRTEFNSWLENSKSRILSLTDNRNTFYYERRRRTRTIPNRITA